MKLIAIVLLLYAAFASANLRERQSIDECAKLKNTALQQAEIEPGYLYLLPLSVRYLRPSCKKLARIWQPSSRISTLRLLLVLQLGSSLFQQMSKATS